MATAHAPTASTETPNEIRIVSHSNLFYLWPIWAIGFLLGLLTLFDNQRLVVVPAGSALGRQATGTITYKPVTEEGEAAPKEDKLDDRDIVIAPKGKKIAMEAPPHLHMTRHKTYGVVFAFTLLIVLFITSVPLRGLWSLIAVILIVSLVIILALLGAWEHILHYLSFLDIRINAAGYFFISGVLLILWLVVFYLFDPQIYMVFNPGQFRVRLAIGEGEMVYDTQGMTLQKERSDLFRHWVLGLGSGDLVVRTAGAQAHQFELRNVLLVGAKLRRIEELLKTRVVVPPAAGEAS